MSDKTDKTTPDLRESFAQVLKWLQLGVSLTDGEMDTLKSAFEMSAKGENAFMVVSSHTRTVAISNQKAVCIDGDAVKDDKRRQSKKKKVIDFCDRDGFFLFNMKADKNAFERQERHFFIDVLYDAAQPDRKMILGS